MLKVARRLNNLPICSVVYVNRWCDLCGLVSEKLEEGAAIQEYFISD
jgi:hypothetical protein